MNELKRIWQGSIPFITGLAGGINSKFPGKLPFSLAVERNTGRMLRISDPFVESAIASAYSAGSHVGNAMDDTPLGRPYCDDLLAFIQAASITLKGSRVLEIGCGRGYLLKRLGELGADAMGVEPGKVYESHWARHGVRVVRSFFPAPEIAGPFDLVVAYGVLEHVHEPRALIRQALATAPGGCALFTVPNCEEAIATGDPSMLIHEHISYFTRDSLVAVAQQAGAEIVSIAKSSYGGSIHVLLRNKSTSKTSSVPGARVVEQGLRYGERINQLKLEIAERIKRAGGSIGVIVPARALNLLPEDFNGRFYDDDPELIGNRLGDFFPFVEPIENINHHSHDEIWICSHSFFEPIQARLLNWGIGMHKIVSLSSLLKKTN